MSKAIKKDKTEKGCANKRGRKIQGNTYRDYCLMVRFNKEESEILESVANDLGLTKADVLRNLLLKEYKKIQRDRASQIRMFKS